MKRVLAGVMVLLSVGCSHTTPRGARWIDPSMAVQLAATAGPKHGVAGVFALQVRGIGSENDVLYLNSERDYRDPRNLTVSLPLAVQAQLREQLGGDPVVRLKNQQILVRGVARTVRINFINADGKPSDKYYYQTQVRVSDVAQLQLR